RRNPLTSLHYSAVHRGGKAKDQNLKIVEWAQKRAHPWLFFTHTGNYTVKSHNIIDECSFIMYYFIIKSILQGKICLISKIK
ncbi:MAG: hypothetical protein WAW75_06275, partial [Gallionella sp.]